MPSADLKRTVKGSLMVKRIFAIGQGFAVRLRTTKRPRADDKEGRWVPLDLGPGQVQQTGSLPSAVGPFAVRGQTTKLTAVIP